MELPCRKMVDDITFIQWHARQRRSIQNIQLVMDDPAGEFCRQRQQVNGLNLLALCKEGPDEMRSGEA